MELQMMQTKVLHESPAEVPAHGEGEDEEDEEEGERRQEKMCPCKNRCGMLLLILVIFDASIFSICF